jgi:hypothetical protein
VYLPIHIYIYIYKGTCKLEIRETAISRPFINYSNRILFCVIMAAAAAAAATTMTTALHTRVRLHDACTYNIICTWWLYIRLRTCNYLRWLCRSHIILHNKCTQVQLYLHKHNNNHHNNNNSKNKRYLYVFVTVYVVCIHVGTNEFRLARRLCNEWDRRGIRIIIRVMYGRI